MEEDPDNTDMWLTWNDHLSTFKGVLSTLRFKGLYADVILMCGAKQYPVHKFILSTCSAYFEKLLETIPIHHPLVVLVITNTSPKDLEALLDFMYLGQTEVNSQDLDRLLDIAYEFRIHGLMNARDEPERQDQEEFEERRIETPISGSDQVDVDRPMPAEYDPDPYNSYTENQDYDEEPRQNGPEEVENSNMSEIKAEDDYKPPEDDHNLPEDDSKPSEEDRPPAISEFPSEYQNFIQNYQKFAQPEPEIPETVETPETIEVTPLANLPEKATTTFKKIVKLPETKSKRGRSKGKVEKLKPDIKKPKEKAKNKTENSREKAKPTKNVEDTKTRIMMCPGCKKTFMCQSVLEDHMKTHEDLEIISCSECPFKALSKVQMQKHMMTHQQKMVKSRPYRCPYCPARQVDKSSFLRHQKTLHPDKKVVHEISEDGKNKRVRQNKIHKDYVRS